MNPKLLESLSTSSCVNLVTIALMVLKLHLGGAGVPEGKKKPGLNRVKMNV